METRSFRTACGGVILLTDETVRHLEAHPEAAALLEEAIAKIVLPTDGSDFFKTVVDLGRVIGQTACVEITDGSSLFAVRRGRTEPTRVVIDVAKPDTTQFVVLARKGTLGDWLLITGYAGADAPREPHDSYFEDGLGDGEFEEALCFWSRHALVWDESMGPVYESTWTVEIENVRSARQAALAAAK